MSKTRDLKGSSKCRTNENKYGVSSTAYVPRVLCQNVFQLHSIFQTVVKLFLNGCEFSTDSGATWEFIGET